MRRIILVLFSILLLIQTYAFAAVIEPARLSLVYGDVMVITPDADDWEPAAVNIPLDEGDAVWCPNGAKAEIQLPNGSTVRLDGGSQLNLLANEGGFMHLNLASGRLYVRTARDSGDNSLQIDADDTTVVPVAGTRLGLAMLSNAQEDVSIFTGSAYVEGNDSRTKVRAGEQLSLEEDYSELLPLNPPDSWEKWNLERDRLQSSAANGAAHLPEELSSFSRELDANGRWVRTAAYGMVWRPAVVLSSDWAPYRSGRWIWRGADYVWIPAESWGWAPYHYGRWTVISNFGWCWIPPARGDVYWGPGYVGWYRTGSYVGWTPLAPGEIYYGYGNHGRHSVNIATTTVNMGSVNYRNRRHRGGTTIVAQNDFLRGRVATVQPVRSASVTVALGSPRIKPPKESRTSAVRHAPAGQVPPRFEPLYRSELRQRFPRVAPAVAVRQKNQPTAPVTAPQQRQQPQPRGAAPVVTPQTPVKSEDRNRQEAAPAARPIHQQSAPVTLQQQRQQPQRPAEAAVVKQQTPVPQEGTSRQATPRRDLNQKKVWRVKTFENGRVKAPKVTEQLEKGGNEKARKERQ